MTLMHLTPLLAQAGEWHAKNFPEALVFSAIFGLLGIFLVLLGFKIFDKLITRIDFQQEINKGNIAAAIVAAAALIGISLIIAAAMS